MEVILQTPKSKYRNSWLELIQSCKIPNTVSAPIAASWQRCLESNLDPRGDNTSKLLLGDDLKALHAARRQLVEASQDSLNVLEKSLVRMPHAILLTDEDGNILHASGSQHVWKYFQQCSLVPGGNASEKFLGTTAPGIVVVEKRPAIVTYEEHFSEIYHWCCCVASPILNSDGKLVGCLDVTTSGDHSESLQLLLGLNLNSTGCIQSEFHAMQFLEKMEEARDFTGNMLNHLEHGIIILDPTGNILHANRRAGHLLKTPLQHLLSKHYGQVVNAEALGRCLSREERAHGKVT